MKEHFQTRILSDPAQLHEIAQDWGQLHQHCPGATPFQRPEWVLAWMDVFSPKDIVTIEVRHDNRLIGIAPLLIYPREQERVLAFMGGGVSDYLDLLAQPEHADDVVFTVLEVATKIVGWDTLDLTDLSANSTLQRTVLAHFSTPHDHCSALALAPTENELLQLLSKRQRANLRNAGSRLKRAGESRFEVAVQDTLPEFLSELFRLHASRWSQAGQPGVLADERLKAFHEKVAPKLLAMGHLRLYRLSLKQRTIAVVYALADRSTVFCYLQGFDPQFAFVSPGTQLMFFAIQDAVRLGSRKFDFLRGEEDYKRHWRAQTEITYRLQISRSEVIPSQLTCSELKRDAGKAEIAV
ncbi:MAG TPA: GNAT family N-acetyltransferase [Terriglobales bacterium]|nr:GNAT family N-acetyltransferase [Terriglobales bacterium]